MKKKLIISFMATALILVCTCSSAAYCADLRDVVCAYIEHMSQIKWTPSKSFSASNDNTQIFRTGKTYIGMPYTENNIGNLRDFRENLDSSSPPKYTGDTAPDKYVGTNSAGAVYAAWKEIGAAVRFKDEKNMFPSAENGVLSVGTYSITANMLSTAEVTKASGESVMYESYAMLHYGDALFKYISDTSKSSFIVTEINVIKSSSGAIDGSKSNILVTGQGIYDDMSSFTSWEKDKKMTFSELFEGNYLPITCSKLKNSDSHLLSPLIYVDEFEGCKKISITDKNTNAAIYYTTDGTTPSKGSTKYSGEIIVTTSVTINTIAISDTDKSPVASRVVEIADTDIPAVTVADFIMGKILTIQAEDADTAIYFSVDGSAFKKYTAPYITDRSCNINCYAVKIGHRRSRAVHTVISMPVVSPPVIKSEESTAGGKRITVTSATKDAVFYYTVNRTEPYEDSKSFTSSIVIGSSCTLKIKAMKSGMGASKTTSIDIDIPKVQSPELILTDFTGGKKAALKCTTSGSRIYYTTDGSSPKVTDSLYDKPFYITDSCTLKAIAVKDGCETAHFEKKIVITQVSIPIIKADSDMNVTLSCESSEAEIYYTVDGKSPTMVSSKYKGSFKVKKGTKIQAIAAANGMKLSDTASVTVNGAVTTESTMVLSDFNYPTSLSFGQDYKIKGYIKSNYNILSVNIGIYDDDGRELAGTVVHPDDKSFDISTLQDSIDFAKSVTGTNYYRIVSADLQGSKTLLNKQFTVRDPNDAVSVISLTNAVYPTTLKAYESFSIHGLITSDYPLRNVSAGIFNTKGRAVSIYNCSPGSKKFYLSTIGSYLDFSSLKKGTYYLRITATDSAVKKTLLNQAFAVLPLSDDSDISLKNESLPEIMEQGSKFNIMGKITSNNIMKYILLELRGRDDRIVFEKKISLNSTEYDISLLADYLHFEFLENGIYKFRIIAADTLERHILTNKEFIITDGYSSHTIDIDNLYSYNFRKNVCTIGNKSYSVSSCGSFAVCAAMVKNYFNGDMRPANPDDILKTAHDNGIFMGSTPSPKELFALMKKNLEMSVKLTYSKDGITDSLKQGLPVIAHTAGGGLNSRSEYVVIKGYSISDEGEFVYINSPSSPILTSRAITLSDFLNQTDSNIFIVCEGGTAE